MPPVRAPLSERAPFSTSRSITGAQGFAYRTFPADIGNEYARHYVLINIYEALGGNLAQRITGTLVESVVLCMPQQVVYVDVHLYDQVSLTSTAGAIAASSVTGSVVGQGAQNLVTTAGGILGNAARLGGFPINPMIEILYTNTAQREFMFDFQLAARNAAEAEALQEIVTRLRYRAAPTPVEVLGANVVWKAPAAFEFIYYHNGAINEHVPRIQKGAIEQIDCDFTTLQNSTWATFKDGHPVMVNLRIKFRELKPINRDDIDAGY